MTLVDLLCYLREHLLESKQKKDDDTLNKLGDMLLLIETAALEKDDTSCVTLVERMYLTVQDYFMGAEFKSDIPSIEEIQSLASRD